jgi:hypothetical protein
VKKIVIVGGGTMSHVRNHLSLCAPAYGATAKALFSKLWTETAEQNFEIDLKLILTKMADPSSKIVTNEDVSDLVDTLIADPDVRSIIFNVAFVDFTGSIGNTPSGKHAKRLKTSDGGLQMTLTPSEKIINRIRKSRKDIFLVAFKTTCDGSSQIQYECGLELLKKNSCNLVLANDTVTRNNMIIAPEETRYCETTDRDDVLNYLAKMTIARIQNHFTRSTVVEGNAIPWSSDEIPNSLRTVVNHCISRAAYKPVLGKTAGHFAVKEKDGTILTSIRKANFNRLDEVGLVKIISKNENEVIAYGHKPSVGGQSQRIVFNDHPDLDCIVHFHCPMKDGAGISVRPQWQNECGSHECGGNTSRGLREMDLGDGHSLSVVFLDNHGPNIVFKRDTPADKVIGFIEKNFDLSSKTGGMVSI